MEVIWNCLGTRVEQIWNALLEGVGTCAAAEQLERRRGNEHCWKAPNAWKLLEPNWNEVGTNMEPISNFVLLFQRFPSLSHCWNQLEGSSSGPSSSGPQQQQRAPAAAAGPSSSSSGPQQQQQWAPAAAVSAATKPPFLALTLSHHACTPTGSGHSGHACPFILQGWR